MITSFHKGGGLLTETAFRGPEFEWPREVAGLLEMFPNGEDFMDQILNTDDSKLTKFLLNDGIVSNGHSLFVDLGMATFVDELTHTLKIGITIGNVWLDNSQHVDGGFVQLNKHTIVDLKET